MSKSPKLYTLDKINQILAKGYPEHDDLVHFPLGDILKQIPETDERYYPHKVGNEEIPGHIERVMKGVNLLLHANDRHKIVKQWEQEFMPADAIPLLFTGTWAAIRRGVGGGSGLCDLSDDEFEKFFRILAVYHDIGKSVIKPRHPLVGWHLITDVHQERVEKEIYPLLREISEVKERKLIQIFDLVIKYHDLFGVLSTGEASLPVMVDLIPLMGTEPSEAKELFSVLMLFNLADLYGSVDEVLPHKVEYFCKDWEILCRAIDEASGDRSEFFDLLLERERGDRVMHRLKRFLNEGAPAEWHGDEIDEKWQQLFKENVLGTRHKFNEQFALVCKLDYALGFKIHLMKKAHDSQYSLEKAINQILWLIAQIVRHYGELTSVADGSYRRLGVDLSGLTRTNDIKSTICDLLLHEKGKEWAIGECQIWFMEE